MSIDLLHLRVLGEEVAVRHDLGKLIPCDVLDVALPDLGVLGNLVSLLLYRECFISVLMACIKVMNERKYVPEIHEIHPDSFAACDESGVLGYLELLRLVQKLCKLLDIDLVFFLKLDSSFRAKPYLLAFLSIRKFDGLLQHREEVVNPCERFRPIGIGVQEVELDEWQSCFDRVAKVSDDLVLLIFRPAWMVLLRQIYGVVQEHVVLEADVGAVAVVLRP